MRNLMGVSCDGLSDSLSKMEEQHLMPPIHFTWEVAKVAGCTCLDGLP